MRAARSDTIARQQHPEGRDAPGAMPSGAWSNTPSGSVWTERLVYSLIETDMFRTAGYPPEVAPEVARLLTGLCTNVVPAEVLDAQPDKDLWSRYRSPHLPQGAPTSRALANLCSDQLNCRLAGLAQAMNARYTRYADDAGALAVVGLVVPILTVPTGAISQVLDVEQVK
jgi:hypothetical protein